MSDVAQPRDVMIVGGGLAGLAAAVALSDAGLSVQLLEARRQLGGRAASYRDPASGEFVDHCQHVSMGCCTNLADFCRRINAADAFRRDRELTFIGPAGQVCRVGPTRLLPPPLHLVPVLFGLKYLSLGDRLAIARAMMKLARTPLAKLPDDITFDTWLRQHGQSEAAIAGFWEVILVSALGETLDRVGVSYARQVFVEGFMVARDASVVEVPRVPLAELYGGPLEAELVARGVDLQLGAAVRGLHGNQQRIDSVVLASGETLPVRAVVLAAPWRRCVELMNGQMPHAAELERAGELTSAPISGVHLWFDRPITPLPHTVLVGRLSQWLFRRQPARDGSEFYYQVVISASRDLAGQPREEVIEAIRTELAEAFPAARDAELLRSKLVTEQEAVFSVAPGVDELRPPQQTKIENLFLAGDWTRTGWPATMEGAVRSGYLAAEAVLRSLNRPQKILVPDLPWGRLARLIIPRV